MNRTFLIILMIGTAMMIAVIGQHESPSNLDAAPWEVSQLKNGSLRVFGITLGKTTIQEANQMFASFAETRLQVNPAADGQHNYQLIARYDDLVISGLVAQIILTYQLNQEQLQNIAASLNIADDAQSSGLYAIDKKSEMKYLSTPVKTITYIPSIDYDLEDIRQRFGQASEEKQINEDEQIWYYPEMRLKIFIHGKEPDQFVYTALH